MFELFHTFKLRKYKGKLTLYEFHIWRLYQKYVKSKIKILKESEGKQ